MPAFYVTGVDYTGEILVRDRQSGNKNKVYIVLYTCGASRGIHLDYVPDMSTQEFLNSFTRFTSRKSTPSQMISDNGLYFQCASEQLKKVFEDPATRNFMAEHNIKWSFIPKGAPWYGGFWERMVGVIKRSLQKVLGRALITEQELYTTLTKIEAVVNDRPLTHISSEMDAISPLTPSHLIYGRRITALPQCHIEEEDYHPTTQTNANKRLAYLSKILDNYWQRFNAEYLPALRDRHKLPDTMTTPPNIKPGDVVLVHEDVVKRSLWKMAVVTKLLPAQDGLTRAAEIRTKNTVTTRPVSKLYPLELSETPESTPVEPQPRDQPHKVLGPDVQNRARPVRRTAREASDKIKTWINIIKLSE